MTSSLKTYILDTNILIHDPHAFLSFEEHNVVIPMTVLEELDNLKDRKAHYSHDARFAIKSIEKVLQGASPEDIINGVQMESVSTKKLGKLSIFNDMELLNLDHIAREAFGLDKLTNIGTRQSPDNLIIQAALYIQFHKGADQKVILVTKDINMRLKSKSVGVKHVEDYLNDHVIDDIDFLSKGYEEFEGKFWDCVKDCDTVTEGKNTFHYLDPKLFKSPYLNQYIFDTNGGFAGKVTELHPDSVVIQDKGVDRMMGLKAWGISPKNIQQAAAFDALLDLNIPMVSLTGPAGSGKTLLALAAALEQVVEKKIYSKIIVTRSTPEIAESIGFLPGTEEEKMAPWLAAITDSMEVLHQNDHEREHTMKHIMEKANIQFKSINFMRGRSINNAILILDESQNLTPSQVKTIITRMGVNSKIILLGNLAQVDGNFVTATSSGLSFAVERMKNFEGSATVNLKGVVRSPLALFAEENL